MGHLMAAAWSENAKKCITCKYFKVGYPWYQCTKDGGRMDAKECEHYVRFG